MAAITAVGIDVGGTRKGFHAIALSDGAYTSQLATSEVETIRDWCLDAMKAQVIAIDAPCRWRPTGCGSSMPI